MLITYQRSAEMMKQAVQSQPEPETQMMYTTSTVREDKYVILAHLETQSHTP